MAFDVITHPEAQDELDEALSYLHDRSLWTAGKLLEEYDLHVTKIAQNPASGHFVYGQYRRLNLNRFSYHIIYRLRASSLYVIALAHDKRHPDYWKSRIVEDQD